MIIIHLINRKKLLLLLKEHNFNKVKVYAVLKKLGRETLCKSNECYKNFI